MPHQTALTKQLVVDVSVFDDAETSAIAAEISEVLARFSGEPAAEPGAVLGWTPARAHELYTRLKRDRGGVQAKVILAAAMDDKGVCSRADVYGFGGFPEGRSLNGFTKPVSRIMRAMTQDGVLPADAEMPMQPIYDPLNASFQQAQGFQMDPDLCAVFSEGFTYDGN